MLIMILDQTREFYTFFLMFYYYPALSTELILMFTFDICDIYSVHDIAFWTAISIHDEDY